MANNGNFSINVKHYSEGKYMVSIDDTILLNNSTYNQCVSYCKMNNLPATYISKALDYNVTTNFTGLLANDVVYLDNDNCIMTSNGNPNEEIF